MTKKEARELVLQQALKHGNMARVAASADDLIAAREHIELAVAMVMLAAGEEGGG